ncbi:MAG: YggT family protein [Spirochaetaceae bacterium]|jgi:YggT family protein|nr:YggT family protein [Spirochaetaceae bacterium]
MGSLMFYITSILSGIISVYIILIFIRILLTWFPGVDLGRPYVFLCGICDPYLNWFHRFRIFKNSPVDFSPLLALAVLSLVQRILVNVGTLGGISIASVLIMLLGAVWSIISWVLIFFIGVLVLRMIAYLGNFNIYSPFWRFVDFIAQPVMYRISRIFFPNRIVNYLFRIIFSIAALVFLAAAVWGLVRLAGMLLAALPV